MPITLLYHLSVDEMCGGDFRAELGRAKLMRYGRPETFRDHRYHERAAQLAEVAAADAN